MINVRNKGDGSAYLWLMALGSHTVIVHKHIIKTDLASKDEKEEIITNRSRIPPPTRRPEERFRSLTHYVAKRNLPANSGMRPKNARLGQWSLRDYPNSIPHLRTLWGLNISQHRKTLGISGHGRNDFPSESRRFVVPPSR
ncbi:hypothetical protein ACLOJK_038730 [Asimina triloba]